MKRILLLPALLIGLLIASCHHEDPFEKEQKEIDAATSSTELQAYKSFKVALRGTAVAGKDSAFDQARREVLAAMAYSFSAATDSTQHIDLGSAIKSSSSLLSSVSLLAKKDEDSLPTVLENIAYVMNADPAGKSSLANFLNESEEHIVLSALWLGTPSAPAGISLYELQKVKDEELRSVDVQLIAKMTRSLLYFKNKWPYHAERSADELVTLTETEKDYLLKNPWPVVDANGNAATPEQAWHQLHGLALLMRAMARLEMEDKDKEATDDLAAFVKDAEEGGFENEATWSIGVIVAIKKDDKTSALNYLAKLEKSKNLSSDELEAIAETKKYLEKKDIQSALAALKDKMAIISITTSYFGNILMHSKPVAQLQTSAGGKKFIAITDLGFDDAVSATKNKMDSAVKKSKSIIDNILK
jgi:uncharacterized protein YnzC (UPF0291/DUF896 family)